MSLVNPNKKKTIVVCNFPKVSKEIWLPFLWAQAKTFYELYGQRVDEWNWYPCYADVYSRDHADKIKEVLRDANPDVFAISLYVWNYTIAHEIAAWVKQQWPDCIVISGGPHQYFKHDLNWFKNHPHLDASLPGDCYGEQCFLEVLDNYNDATKTINWQQVTDIYYPSKGRMVLSSKKTMSRADKKRYLFEWSAYKNQQNHIVEFVQYQHQIFPQSMLLGVLETTRGCPYGCTYCDWGGGTNTTVLQKSLLAIKHDIDVLMKLGLTYLYIADANFGIFGERDVAIIDYIACEKHRTHQCFNIGYGGYAKTENKLKYIKEILVTDILYGLSVTKELKLSMQTLDKEVLDNIDRKNISLDKQLEIFQPLAKNNKLPLFVELIIGLPGITLDKYYHELDVLGKNNLSINWYEWILLPETPAYVESYRQKYGIKTIIKKRGWVDWDYGSDREVVVACSSYTTDDYLQMLLSNSLYHLFVSGGYSKNIVSWITNNCQIAHGKLIRDIYENFLNHAEVIPTWEKIINDSDVPCVFPVCGHTVYGAYYFVAKVFLDRTFSDNLIAYLTTTYNVPESVVDRDIDLNINADNYGKTKWRNLYKFSYVKNARFSGDDVDVMISTLCTYNDPGNAMRGTKKLFGFINVDN